MIKSVCHEEKEIGHIPIEISQLINYFLEAATTKTMTAVVQGKETRNWLSCSSEVCCIHREPEACPNFDKKTA